MFYEKWSHKVTLPLGQKWGNNIGGVAACLNWSRPQVPPSSGGNLFGGVTHRGYEAYDRTFTPEYTDRTQRGTARQHETKWAEEYPLAYTSIMKTPEPEYYSPLPPYGTNNKFNTFVNGRTSRASSANAERAAQKYSDLNDEQLLEKLKMLTKKHDDDRLARMVERNAKAKGKKLAFAKPPSGAASSRGKGYGSMGPPPKRMVPTPPPSSRNRPGNPIPRPHSSAGKTETYRYTEREIVIEDIDDNTKRNVRKDLTVRPRSQQGYYVSNGRESEQFTSNVNYNAPRKYGTTSRFNESGHQNYGRYSRPGSAAFGSKAMERYYSDHDVDSFSATPIGMQTKEFERPMSKAEFLRSRAQTPQRALTSYRSHSKTGYAGERGDAEAHRGNSVSKVDDNITIHVDCAKLVGANRPKTVTVRLHGVESGDAENIKVLTVPNTAGSK